MAELSWWSPTGAQGGGPSPLPVLSGGTRTRTGDTMIFSRARGVAEVCEFPIPKPFSLPCLPRVAPYCTPGGVRVCQAEPLFR
jgi:hypothetical protein